MSIKPTGEVLPDAGPDGSPEAGAGDAAALADRGTGHDAAPLPEEPEDGADAAGVADVHLRVGCACDTGRGRPSHTGFALVLVVLLARARRRNSR
jgi:MYXO-CTERM domain-containing protein